MTVSELGVRTRLTTEIMTMGIAKCLYRGV